jgi:hypothetical protein
MAEFKCFLGWAMSNIQKFYHYTLLDAHVNVKEALSWSKIKWYQLILIKLNSVWGYNISNILDWILNIISAEDVDALALLQEKLIFSIMHTTTTTKKLWELNERKVSYFKVNSKYIIIMIIILNNIL